MATVNIIGSETYVKSCPFERRWDLEVSEEQAERIASGVRRECINLRLVQGRFIDADDETTWFGDNFGRIAEGLSQGLIQLQPEESKKPLPEMRTWTHILTREAIGWKAVAVAYVYLGDRPSEELIKQTEDNPTRKLFSAGKIFPGQFVGLRDDMQLVIGDTEDAVVAYIRSEAVKIL